MRFLICHERFLFRFGADRVLILLGKGLKELGHEVSIMANRYDRKIVETFASRIIDVSAEGAAYINLNESTADWVRNTWHRHFAPGAGPDVVLVGGWPFISAISVFKEFCPHVVFIDCGVVPSQGYSEGMANTLDKLHSLRQRHLPDASLIICNSRFTAESQSEPDCGGGVPVRPVLLGADHMEMSVWPAADLSLEQSRRKAVGLLRDLKSRGKKVLISLGRWEPGCYKNSQFALELVRRLKTHFPDCALLILEHARNIKVPPDLNENIFPIGFPDDRELAEIMKEADLGISVSLWEGFNLPLAEMQWFGRPVLAFDLAAHPEVAAHPWYLCRDIADMAFKAAEALRGGGPDPAAWSEALGRFRACFTWNRFIRECCELLNALPRAGSDQSAFRAILVVDVTNSTRDPANSGVIRVTRRLSRTLQRFTNPIFVVWEPNQERYVLPTLAEHEQLSRFNGPLLKDQGRLSPDSKNRLDLDELPEMQGRQERWLLLPETMMETEFQRIRLYARAGRFHIAAIFYDAIPVLRPDLCNDEMRGNHRFYMRGLAECDLVLPISAFSATCLTDFWRTSQTGGGCRVVPNLLPGEFGGSQRNEMPARDPAGEVRILCVSTLEPRKNHRNLIAACLRMRQEHPELRWSLALVGNRYAGACGIADFVQEIAVKDPRIQWLGIVDDETLIRLYREASFTVYPSMIEGFGMPILESMWHGRPCICSREGVMAELAAGGGCLTTDVTDAARLAEALFELSTNDSLRLKLSREAAARAIKTWDDYVRQFLNILGEDQPAPNHLPAWPDILYRGCLPESWQMDDAERLALMALLARHKPKCGIEAGTFRGGSLPLISRHSKMVFSIDTDPALPARFGFLSNVSFLTGEPSLILPHLLRELHDAGVAADFILIDGNHSGAGMKRDIEPLLSYVPQNPLFVLLHGSFNPECRRGMLEAAWESSPYCHWVDLDFVPGRIVENGGAARGELRGGLALAYFLPAKRAERIVIGRSAENMFHILRDWSRSGKQAPTG